MLQLFRDVTIASDFVKARIAAFARAHEPLLLCKVCLDRETAARRLVAAPRSTATQELLDPSRDWCFLCGALAPTLPALPRQRVGKATRAVTRVA